MSRFDVIRSREVSTDEVYDQNQILVWLPKGKEKRGKRSRALTKWGNHLRQIMAGITGL